VRDQDEGDADLALDRLQLHLHVPAQFAVEGGQRFVEQEDGGAVDEGAGEGDALLLTARQLPDPAAVQAFEAHQFEGLVDAAGDFRLARARRTLLQAIADIAGDIEVREQRVVLKHHVHGTAVGGDADDRTAADFDVAFARLLEACDQPQGRGLAAPRRTQERMKGATADGEAHLVDGRYVAEPLGHVDEADVDVGRRVGGRTHDTSIDSYCCGDAGTRAKAPRDEQSNDVRVTRTTVLYLPLPRVAAAIRGAGPRQRADQNSSSCGVGVLLRAAS